MKKILDERLLLPDILEKLKDIVKNNSYEEFHSLKMYMEFYHRDILRGEYDYGDGF